MNANDNKGAIGYEGLNSGVSLSSGEYNYGNFPLSSDVGNLLGNRELSVATVLGDEPLSLGNTQEKYSPAVTDKLFVYNTRVDNTLNLKEFDEGKYFEELKKLIQEYNVVKEEILSKSHGEDVHKQLEEELTHYIGSLNDLFNLPPEYRYLVKDTKKVVNKIEELGGIFKVGLNSYLVPGSMSSIRKLIENGVLNGENVEIDLGAGDNLQEGIRIIKKANGINSGSVIHFDNKLDKLNKLKIKLGNNSSVAHGVIFEAEEGNNNEFEYDLKVGDNVFLGINAHIGSNVSIGDNTTIWWGSSIGHRVKIGKNVVVGQGVTVNEGVEILDNCLVPNGAVISKGFKTIDYKDYIKDKFNNDVDNIGLKDRRNFVIKLSDNKEDQKIQMNKINKDYGSMIEFNEYHVIPENKLFAVINTNLAIISEHFPKANILQELVFDSKIELSYLKDKLPDLDEKYLKEELKKTTKVTLKAYPKNKEKFITELMPRVIKAIEDKEDITEIIKTYLDYPEIKGDKSKIFGGTVFCTGKISFDETNKVFGGHYRCDEDKQEHNISIENCFFYNAILHGGQNKNFKNVEAINCTLHGKMDVQDSIIGNVYFPSVYHNCELDKVIQSEGGVIANSVTVIDAKIGFNVSLMPGAKITKSELGPDVIVGDSSIYNCLILPNTKVGKNVHFYGGKVKGVHGGIIYGEPTNDTHLLSSLVNNG